MTFNVAAGVAPPEEVVASIRRENADIVGIQELGPLQSDMIRRELTDEYPYWILQPGHYEGKGLLSRFPLTEIEHLDVAPGRPDLMASVRIGENQLQVMVVHPRPPGITRQGIAFDAITQMQIAQIVATAIERSPSLILGDLNMTKRHPFYSDFVTAGLIDAFLETGARGATLPARIGNTRRVGERWQHVRIKPVVRVDFIWYTTQLQASASWVGEDGGSDHLPVVAEMIWRNNE